jgi:hypothetical protein
MPQMTIEGFRKKSRRTASGGLFTGRFTCHDVQWTGDGADKLVTFTVTAAEIVAAAESNVLWTDQDVQRGIKPGLQVRPARELSLAQGYPNTELYVFDSQNADDMAEKLLRGEKLFLNPLVWNLRPGMFDAYWNAESNAIHLYSGNVYLPDSHHRHQAIIKAVHTWRDAGSTFPNFNEDRQFKIELYFLNREDEGNYFFDKNQRPKPTALSKAYDLTTLDDLSLLAKAAIEKSKALADNVNRVTDRLVAKNPQVMTLSTLREMMKPLVPDESLDSAELQGLATVVGQFYDLLAGVRPELGHLAPALRRQVRDRLVVDAAVMMHGYAALIPEFNNDIGRLGLREAIAAWTRKLERLSKDRSYRFGNWRGDFFDKHNPLWLRVGLVKPGRDGRRLTVLNTGAARGEARRILRTFLSLPAVPRSLSGLVRR